MRTTSGLFILSILFPATAHADLDMAFLLDTTGSMSGEIREAKERVRQLAASLSESRPNEHIRIGVVAFRDRGDSYVTKVSPLSPNVDESFEFLAALVADGGGDGPEDVLSGLEAAIEKLDWDARDQTEKQIFLIGDAPPHLDYPDGPRLPQLLERAASKGIVLNAIGCRSLPANGVDAFRRMAYRTEGRYQHIGRVETERLSETLLESLTSDDVEAERRAAPALPVRTTRAEPLHPREKIGLLVDYSPSDGTSDRQCRLSLYLPPKLKLIGPVEVRRGRRALFVYLGLTSGGDGEHRRLEVEDCEQAALPIQLSIGGLR